MKTNNPNGRPAGVPNRATTRMREIIIRLMDETLPAIQKDLLALKPKDRLEILIKLLPFVLPKEVDPLYSLTEEQIDDLLERIMKAQNEKAA